MAFIEIGKARRQSEEYISIAGKYSRLTLFYKVYEKMKEKHGDKEFKFVRFFVDDKDQGKFWMKPADDGEIQIRIVGSGNRILSIFQLLQALGWTREDTVRLPVSYDNKRKAFVVDCRESLKEQERLKISAD